MRSLQLGAEQGFLRHGVDQLRVGLDVAVDPLEVLLEAREVLAALQLAIVLIAFSLMVLLVLVLKRTRLGKAVRAVAENPQTSYLLGILWGLLPCGLVLTALLTAVTSTNAVQGMLNMLIFGIATIPSLFAVRWLATKSLPRHWSRSLASIVMMLFGFQFAMRGFASLGWVGHFMLGSIMFW